MKIPSSPKERISFCQDIIKQCFAGADARTNQYRAWREIYYKGNDTNSAIYNRLPPHIERLSSYLFSPYDLRFSIEYEHTYGMEEQKRAEVSAQQLTKHFKGRNLDIKFSRGIGIGLTYGACYNKLLWTAKGPGSKLIMPWSFGVYREDVNSLDEQEAMCEKTYITRWEFWRRIGHRSDAAELMKKAIKALKKQASDNQEVDSYWRQVVVAGTPPIISTSGEPDNTVAGNMPILGDLAGVIPTPTVDIPLLPFYEITVIDDELEDYVTLQYMEPDIVIEPYLKKKNLFIKGSHPYTLIQPNEVEGYHYGMSELSGLINLQLLLAMRLVDIKKIMSLEYDRLLAFIGFGNITPDAYDNLRQQGYISQETPGAKVEDLTPKLPDSAWQDLKSIMDQMDDVSGFQNILSGQGEAGVRAGNHAKMLLKTASPRLRDRALLVERQLAELGDKVLDLLKAKDPTVLWTNPDAQDQSQFTLAQLPEDTITNVDSHSSSPIYEDDHKEMLFALRKMQAIDGEDLLETLPGIPQRELLKLRLREREKAKAEMLKKHPELLMGKGRGRKPGG